MLAVSEVVSLIFSSEVERDSVDLSSSDEISSLLSSSEEIDSLNTNSLDSKLSTILVVISDVTSERDSLDTILEISLIIDSETIEEISSLKIVSLVTASFVDSLFCSSDEVSFSCSLVTEDMISDVIFEIMILDSSLLLVTVDKIDVISEVNSSLDKIEESVSLVLSSLELDSS